MSDETSQDVTSTEKKPKKTRKPEPVNSKEQAIVVIKELEKKYLNYIPLYLVAFSLPIRPLKVTVQEKNKTAKVKFQSKLELVNGNCSLKLIADEDYGHPFGKDRLLLAFLFSKAVKTSSRYIYYDSIKKLLEAMGLEYSKTNRDWVYASINRINNCYLQFSLSDTMICATKNGHILDTVVGPLNPERWKSEKKIKDKLSAEDRKKYIPKDRKFTECYFELSQDLFDHLMKTSVPFDIRVINSLGENYGTIDLYLFWNWRNYRLYQDGDGLVNILLADMQKHMIGAKDKRKYAQQTKDKVTLLKKTMLDVYGDSDLCKIEVFGNNVMQIKTTPPLIPITSQREQTRVTSQTATDASKTNETDDFVPMASDKFEAVRKAINGMSSMPEK